MRRPLTADPAFFTMVDIESRLLGCSSPAIIRCGTLEFLARNHQTRIPTFFREEREIVIFQSAIEAAVHPLAAGADSIILKELNQIDETLLKQAVYDAIVQAMEKERSVIFKRTHQRRHANVDP